MLAAEAAEAHGRCLTGDRRDRDGSTDRLKAGLRAAMAPQHAFTTPSRRYDVDDCVALRHFTTHGGTTPGTTDVLDGALLSLDLRSKK